ncbi:MAG: nuclear transport factor 2 family protein [Pseudomonadota bacterium]
MSQDTPNEDWVLKYFQDVDSRDVEKILSYYATNAKFRFGNQDAAIGIGAIEDVLRGFFDQIDQIQHKPRGIWLGELNAVLEAEVRFQVGAAATTVPAVSIMRMDAGGKVADFRFVMDAAPVFELISARPPQ